MANTKIEWTEETWNPVTGCEEVSGSWVHCYAEVMARRLQAMGQDKYEDGFEVRVHESELNRPNHWRVPCKVFVSSMGDTFHEQVPDEFIERIQQVIADNEVHIFQLLTKRAERLRDFPEWPDNA
ncbi:phage Gp37/Gp68 family protein [Candidatus Bipolaricaulota bacterium]|nr:phage Gp37/Gp68 family protein [Candidatus Bipolaricaulota bacterium]